MIDLKDAINEVNRNISFEGAKMLTEGECVIYLRELERLRAIVGDMDEDRLRELIAAARDGRCVVLPCKVGDTVYKIWYHPCKHGETYPDSYSCSGCYDECDLRKDIFPVTINCIEQIIGRSNSVASGWLYLTPAEAEAALIKENRPG